MVFKSIVMSIFVLMTGMSHAALQASNGRDTIVLNKEACTVPAALAVVPPQMQGALKSGDAVVNGQKFQLCWVVIDGTVGLIFEDGDVGTLPLQDFKEMGV